MNDKERFETLKSEILHRAKEKGACKEQYVRAYKSETFAELMEVLRDNFKWACVYNVLDTEILEKYKDDFAKGKIYMNCRVSNGFLLASGNATVEASDNATVRASDNATVRASDNATVEAWDNVTVEAWDNVTVRAWGNATVEAWGNATVEAWGNATVEAWGNATVEASDNATVEARGSAYISSYNNIHCELYGNAIYRIRKSNTIRYVSDRIRFEKV